MEGRLTSEVKDGSVDDSLSNVVTDLEVSRQYRLRVVIHLTFLWHYKNIDKYYTPYIMKLQRRRKKWITVGWRKEVEEWIVLDGFRDSALHASRLVLLRLLHKLHRHVLARVPINLAPFITQSHPVNVRKFVVFLLEVCPVPCAFDDLGSFVCKRVVLVGVCVHVVLLGEDTVYEVLVFAEQKLESEALKAGIHNWFKINQSLHSVTWNLSVNSIF